MSDLEAITLLNKIGSQYRDSLKKINQGRTQEKYDEEVKIYRELYAEFGIPFNHDGGIDDPWRY